MFAFNYHTHTYRSGHSEYSSDAELLAAAKDAGISMLGFSEHIPNPDLMLPDEDSRMLQSEVANYISSIAKMKELNPDMIILAGFEAEFDPMKEAYLVEMREKVDYMVLGQHFITRGLGTIFPNNNPNYPIEYANMIGKAIDSGIFDIVAHPDYFMKFRDTIADENARKLFDENAVLASQFICEKARDLGIPVEINFGAAEKNSTLSNGNLDYPHPVFWQVASEIEGLQVICGIDAHNLRAFETIATNEAKVASVSNLVKDKIIKDKYNLVEARQNNKKLQEAYLKSKANALTYETHMVKQIVDGSLVNVNDELGSEVLITAIGASLNGVMQSCIDNANKKSKSTLEEISKIVDSSNLLPVEKKGKYERKKMAVQEINQVVAKQKRTIETAKENVLNAMNIGCETKYEYSNIVAQLTQYESTNNDLQKQQIEQHIESFGQSKGITNIAYQMARTNSKQNNGNNSNKGSLDIVVLVLVVTFIIVLGIGIGYVICK